MFEVQHRFETYIRQQKFDGSRTLTDRWKCLFIAGSLYYNSIRYSHRRKYLLSCHVLGSVITPVAREQRDEWSYNEMSN